MSIIDLRGLGNQAAPVANTGPSAHDLVVSDLRQRKEFGFEKYGTELQPDNGRDSLQDAYEEVLDLAVYLRNAIEERTRRRARVAKIAERLSMGDAPGADTILELLRLAAA